MRREVQVIYRETKFSTLNNITINNFNDVLYIDIPDYSDFTNPSINKDLAGIYMYIYIYAYSCYTVFSIFQYFAQR